MMLRPTARSPSGFAEFKEPEHDFEGSPRMGRSFTITTDQNIEVVEWIVMPDQQSSVRRVAYKLACPTIATYEIMSNYLSMKKVSTRWVPGLLIPIQQLSQESKVNPDNYLDRIVTDDEIWVYCYDPLSQQEVLIRTKPGEETQQVDFVEQDQLKRS